MKLTAITALAILGLLSSGCDKIPGLGGGKKGAGEKTAAAPSAAPTAAERSDTVVQTISSSARFDITGKWKCRFNNGRGSSVTETVTFTDDGAKTKSRVSGVDGAGSRYSGNGTATVTDDEWKVTFYWNNGASPTWIKVKPSSDGASLSGRRGKNSDRSYEGDYNCSRVD